MQYQIQGQPYPVVVLTVEPEETVLCQKGAMAWMTPNMEMQTKGGGLGKMFSRAFTGESMFQNHYTAKGGQGMIAFASAVPGEIMPVLRRRGLHHAEILRKRHAVSGSRRQHGRI